MDDVLKTIAVFFLAVVAARAGYMFLEAVIPPDAAPAVEEANTDDLTAGRYHQRARTNDFFRRGRG